MLLTLLRTVVFCLVALVAGVSCAARTTTPAPPPEPTPTVDPIGPPSDDAKDMPGAVGTIRFTPADWQGTDTHPSPPGPTTFWIDTDGVDPGTAGCHRGTDAGGVINQRIFAEGCRSDTLLIESNPARDKLHPHENDVGHPDLFNCVEWCRGQGAVTGSCKPAVAVSPCPPSTPRSARCECSR